MSKARLIALYLPQFHPIPENDLWWGKGFTEWTNTAKAKPLYPGHEVPNIPADLGYYDLRVPETREAQAELAKAYGIEGFCYWHYWFGGGKRLLERPFNEVLRSGKPDFPFCLGWANHTWSGIWHGCPDRILIEQTYPGRNDVIAHFYSMLDAFLDPRYLKIDGRNIFCIYKPKDLQEPGMFIDTWRELAQREGLKGFYFIAMVDYPWVALDDGYDAFTTNPPVAMVCRQNVPPLHDEFAKLVNEVALPQIYSYRSFVENAFPEKVRRPDFFPCVVPNWDNTPRSGANGIVLHGSTPELYARHLREAVELVADRVPDQQVIFVKSWNEWAETNYLEPDLRFGRAYLEATRRVIAGGDQESPIVHFLNVRTTHHSGHSGYDRFMDFIPHARIPVSTRWNMMSDEERKQAYDEAKAQITWYNPGDLEKETNVNAFDPCDERHVCHFLYGENSVFHIAKSNSPNKKIFATFHQPPDAHQQFIHTREPLQALDGIIVVGTNQIPFFEQYVDRSKIHFVPHGVDTDYFMPDPTVPKDPNKVLFVGNWLRDFDSLIAVANLLAEKDSKITIDVVTLDRNKPLFEGCRNVQFSSGIPEEVLLRKYREAALLFVPMKDCTANNSVLEGMACGLPVVTTDIGGIKDYVDSESSILFRPFALHEAIEAIITILKDENKNKAMSFASRNRSLFFSWYKVSEKLTSIYSNSF